MIIFQSKLFSSYLIRSRFPIHKAFFTPKTVTGIFPQKWLYEGNITIFCSSVSPHNSWTAYMYTIIVCILPKSTAVIPPNVFTQSK